MVSEKKDGRGKYLRPHPRVVTRSAQIPKKTWELANEIKRGEVGMSLIDIWQITITNLAREWGYGDDE